MALSDWRNVVVDLTNDTDSGEDDGGVVSLSAGESQAVINKPATPVPPKSNGTRPASHGSACHTPHHASALTADSLATPSCSSKGTSLAARFRNDTASEGYSSSFSSTQSGTNSTRTPAKDSSAKRRKISVPIHPIEGYSSGKVSLEDTPHWAIPSSRAAITEHRMPAAPRTKPRISNKTPSVHDMNTTLRTNKTSISFLDDVIVSAPRQLHIGRLVQDTDDTSSWLASSSVPASEPVQSTASLPTPPSANVPPTCVFLEDEMEIDTSPPSEIESANRDEGIMEEVAAHQRQEKPTDHAKDEMAAVFLNVPQVTAISPGVSEKETEGSTTTTASVTPASTKSTSTGGRVVFTEEDDHFLIFLKEVKKYKWRDITTEFAKHRPGRPYVILQSRYSSVLNKRNRSEDPEILNLPLHFSAEATVDWPAVYTRTPGTRDLSRPASPRNHASSRRVPELVAEQGYSSGVESGSRRERSRRTRVVNYTLPSLRGAGQAEEHRAFVNASAGPSTAMRLESSDEEPYTVHVETALPHDSLKMQFDADDASIGLTANQRLSRDVKETLPYLSLLQRRTIQDPLSKLEWDQSASREWKGTVLHVDFSPVETRLVESTTKKLFPCESGRSRHTTRRRNIRHILKSLAEPSRFQLAHAISKRLSSRSVESIRAFLDDALTGSISKNPQVQRLATVKSVASDQGGSTVSTIRRREMGLQTSKGWKAASRPLSYQTRNMMMDTLGSTWSWTGASSDIHTVAWSPHGECFAAGAVAVTDQDSMQYNRPNNLLYGNVSDGVIHELGEHNIQRQKTETGANSTNAMFETQDPVLYTTVSSVAFSRNGNIMYSSGYDKNVCVWNTTRDSSQPTLARALIHKAEVDMMAVSQTEDGVMATAAKRTSQNAVKLLYLDETRINDDNFRAVVHNYNSKKAVDKPGLNILPTALQFEPRYGRLLLAGFGANVRQDHGLDTTGDLCAWDIETQTQLPVHGFNRNVFDVTFNPNQRHMPFFATGCVASGNVNRGVRSVIRLYAGQEPIKYTCALELECVALDMNDVIWCPYDEALIAAGCTDGRVYVWDLRRHDVPLCVLSHGQSLMPLQDDVPHEVTDTGIRFLSWGDNATRLYSGSSDGVVKVWDVTHSKTDIHVKDLVHTDSGIMSGAFSPDFSKLVLGEVNGSVNVLEVGGAGLDGGPEELRYSPWNFDSKEDVDNPVLDTAVSAPAGSAAELTDHLLQTEQLQLVPMGGLPIRQAVQGTNYAGPYDLNVDAPYLRQQALEFQLEMAAMPPPSCEVGGCKASINKVTSEEAGDSGRSSDRIPDELRAQWKAPSTAKGTLLGKSKCAKCNRPARPSTSTASSSSSQFALTLCERCAFACLRCGAANPIGPETTTLICGFCAGVWDMGALGYECVQQPLAAKPRALDVPLLTAFAEESYGEFVADAADTAFGDDVNALSDYYFSLAIDRPESPLL